MRNLTRLTALALIPALASPALAQQAKGFGGVNPANIVQMPVAQAGATSSIATIPLFDHSIHLRDFFPQISTFSNHPVIGQSTYPTPDNMPGLNYLKAFGFSQPQAQAVVPGTPTKKKRIPTILLSRPENMTNTSK
jgi:hypothetical protein